MNSVGAGRILIYGVTGSGKTTLAEQLGRATGLPWVSVDDLTWEPDWVAVPVAEQTARITRICARDEWILDSGYSHWIDVVLARVELIVGLDYPRWLSLGRLLRRTVVRSATGRSVCNGNRERLRAAFGRDSIVRWHFGSFAGKRRRMRAWADTPPGAQVRVLLFRSPGQARRWLEAVAVSAG